MARGNLGYGDQRDLGPDIMNELDDEPSMMRALAIEMSEHDAMKHFQDQLDELEADGLIVIDKETFEGDWLITPME